MTDKHVSRHGLHLVGFSELEVGTIESFFKIAGSRPPGWWVTPNPQEAAILLVNAATRQAVDNCRAILSPWHKVVAVGASDYGSGWPTIARPIKLMVILNKINEVLAAGAVPQSDPALVRAQAVPPYLAKAVSVTVPAPLTAPVPLQMSSPVPATRPAAIAAPSDDHPVDAVASPLNAPVRVVAAPVSTQGRSLPAVPIEAARSFVEPMAGSAKMSIAPAATSVTARVLVVDDSDVALKFMQNRLRQYGYDGQLARSGEEALAMVADKAYKFVFLDVMMAGLDGYQTCRAIKQNKNHHGQTPVVVMLTSRGGTIDKIRGSMAGCDAYLTKPLNERQLAAVLAKYDAADSKTGGAEAQESRPQSRFLDSVFPRR